MGGGDWEGSGPAVEPARAALLGFFIGAGHRKDGDTPAFRIRKRREIVFLRSNAAAAGFEISFDGRDRYYLIADEDFRLLAKKCYTPAAEKCIPPDVLHEWGAESLRALLDGLMNSDGDVSSAGKETYSTTSRVLADQIQELALKCGRAATLSEDPFDSDPAHLGRKSRYRLTIYRGRTIEPKVGRTTRDTFEQVHLEPYRGILYCVTVPNGTLYVRRNGKPMWCGNSPFEHNGMTFLVSAPIFVFREFHRHRVGWSYNESSGRYRELEPVFYVPGRDRRLVQQGKPGSYEFVPGTEEQHEIVEAATRDACLVAYERYQVMLAAGVAREVARGVLPVCTYSSMYATCNARSLMSFLSLRTRTEESAFPSFPQREIEMVAEEMERHFARLMPITHSAFVSAGRVSP
jgi:thymidylate synthase (FAD)